VLRGLKGARAVRRRAPNDGSARRDCGGNILSPPRRCLELFFDGRVTSLPSGLDKSMRDMGLKIVSSLPSSQPRPCRR
jgi:hypothetical protein